MGVESLGTLVACRLRFHTLGSADLSRKRAALDSEVRWHVENQRICTGVQGARKLCIICSFWR